MISTMFLLQNIPYT